MPGQKRERERKRLCGRAVSAGTAPVIIISRMLRLRSFLGEGADTPSGTAWTPHHTCLGPCHRNHKKPYKAQPICLCLLASDTQHLAEDPQTSGAVSRVGKIYLSGKR